VPAFNVEFYKPHVVNVRGVAFPDLLDRIVAMNAVDRIRRGNDPAAILTLQHQQNEFLGEAARIRMEDLPSVIDTATGDRHDLDVRVHEGLGEEIHFLYDAALDVVAVQNKGHFRAAALEQLISDLTHAGINFHIILRADAWERFQNMELVTKINFKLARPRDIQGRPAVMRVFREIDEFNGVSAKVEITVGRNRNRSLSMAAIRRVIADYNAMGQSFKDLSITGAVREAEGELHRDTIDFLKERLLVSVEVERRGRGRRLDAEGCRLALRRSIREHQEYLRRYRG
jgi:hypothetical protein